MKKSLTCATSPSRGLDPILCREAVLGLHVRSLAQDPTGPSAIEKARHKALHQGIRTKSELTSQQLWRTRFPPVTIRKEPKAKAQNTKCFEKLDKPHRKLLLE